MRGSFCHQLNLTATLHGDVPPSSCFDRVAHRQEAMVLQNHTLVLTQGIGNANPLFKLKDNAVKIVIDHMVVVKSTGVEGNNVQRFAKR